MLRRPLGDAWPILKRTLILMSPYEVNTLLDSVPIMDTSPWKPMVGPLSVSTSISVPLIIELSKLERKSRVPIEKRKFDLSIFIFDESSNNQSFENWVEVNKIDEKD